MKLNCFPALAELNISQFDVIFLAFPAIPEDSRLTFTEVAKPLWRVRVYFYARLGIQRKVFVMYFKEYVYKNL